MPAALSDILLRSLSSTVSHPVRVSLTSAAAAIRRSIFSQMSMPLPRCHRPPAAPRRAHVLREYTIDGDNKCCGRNSILYHYLMHKSDVTQDGRWRTRTAFGSTSGQRSIFVNGLEESVRLRRKGGKEGLADDNEPV